MMQSTPDWKKMEGLLPAIVQDSSTKEVLMQGYMNKEALEKTNKTGEVTFYSRSKQRLWTKGETSGNKLLVEKIELDCDQDSLLIQVQPKGPTCHLGTNTCWGEKEEANAAFIARLEAVINDRFTNENEGSYIRRLIEKGTSKMAQKVGEEGVEVALAAVQDDLDEFREECADLFFHMLVLMRQKEVKFSEILKTLEKRHRESEIKA